MIIGVGNDQFAWMHGMGIGVGRALRDILVLCVPNLRLAVRIRHARTNFIAVWCGEFGEMNRFHSRFFAYIVGPSAPSVEIFQPQVLSQSSESNRVRKSSRILFVSA